MMRAIILKREAVLAGIVMIVCLAFGCVGEAVAAEPWWHVVAISSPAGSKEAEAVVTLDIANVGDSSTPGSISENFKEALTGEKKHFVTVVDKLPAGVTPTGVHAEGGGTIIGVETEEEVEEYLSLFGHPKLCSIIGQTVSCAYAAPVRPYEHIVIAINAKVTAGSGDGQNEVDVSGGGAPPAFSRHALALEGQTSYGVQSYELTPEEEGGLPTTQAGSHPFQLTTTLIFNAQAVPIYDKFFKENRAEVRPLAMTKDLRLICRRD